MPPLSEYVHCCFVSVLLQPFRMTLLPDFLSVTPIHEPSRIPLPDSEPDCVDSIPNEPELWQINNNNQNRIQKRKRKYENAATFLIQFKSQQFLTEQLHLEIHIQEFSMFESHPYGQHVPVARYMEILHPPHLGFHNDLHVHYLCSREYF